MKTYNIFFRGIILIYPNIFFPQNNRSDYQRNWPQWRGPDGNGISPNGNPPMEWNETKNIKWKVEVPGKGHSAPVVWANQIFLITAIPADKTNEIKQPAISSGESDPKSGTIFEIAAKNFLEYNFIASPVIIGNTIYLGGYKYLYNISQEVN